MRSHATASRAAFCKSSLTKPDFYLSRWSNRKIGFPYLPAHDPGGEFRPAPLGSPADLLRQLLLGICPARIVCQAPVSAGLACPASCPPAFSARRLRQQPGGGPVRAAPPPFLAAAPASLTAQWHVVLPSSWASGGASAPPTKESTVGAW